MTLYERNMIKTRTLYAAKDLEITHQQQAVFAALVTTGSGTFDKGTVVVDTRIDDDALTGGSTDQGDLIPFLTPLVYDASGTPGWRVWTNGQTVDAFAGGQTGLSLHETGLVKTLAAGETIGVVILGGKVPADQVVLPAGETQNNLDAALKTGMRAKGFFILNLEGAA